MKTLVVNLFAGPGSGKSTISAGIFFDLKNERVNCELAPEFAKDLVWEENYKTLGNQIYVFGTQHHRIYRLLGNVDVVITDSPLLLTPIYDYHKRPLLKALAIEEHKKMWTYNIFLKRKKPYNKKGRNQTEEEAKNIDREILDILDECGTLYETFDGSEDGKHKIVTKIKLLLEYNN